MRCLSVSSVVALLLGGCVGYTRSAYVEPQRAASPTVEFTIARLALDRQPPPSLGLVERSVRAAERLPAASADDHHDRAVELRYPSASLERGRPREVVALLHRSRLAGPRPAVIVLPIWGRSDYPPRKVAAALRRRGAGAIHVVRVLGPDELISWGRIAAVRSERELQSDVEELARRLSSAASDVETLIDRLSQDPAVDRERIAVVGFSMSAVVSGIVATRTPKLRAGVLVLGGGSLPDILANCPYEIGAARDKALARLGWTQDRLRAFYALHTAWVDPALAASVVDPRSVLLVEGRRDRCMPRSSRDALWQAMGRPERLTLGYGHRSSFMALTPLGFNTLRRQIYRFLASRFAAPAKGGDDARAATPPDRSLLAAR